MDVVAVLLLVALLLVALVFYMWCVAGMLEEIRDEIKRINR